MVLPRLLLPCRYVDPEIFAAPALAVIAVKCGDVLFATQPYETAWGDWIERALIDAQSVLCGR